MCLRSTRPVERRSLERKLLVELSLHCHLSKLGEATRSSADDTAIFAGNTCREDDTKVMSMRVYET